MQKNFVQQKIIESGITQVSLATKTGWNPVKVHRILTGETEPTASEIDLLEQATNGLLRYEDFKVLHTQGGRQ